MTISHTTDEYNIYYTMDVIGLDRTCYHRLDLFQTPAQLVEWLKEEAERRGQSGINAYSLRVGGARQLSAHLKPGLSQEALRAVGVWADDSMARYYGGASIESFREHARMMVQPTTILPR